MSDTDYRKKVEDAGDASSDETERTHGSGRPSSANRLQIELRLRPYFERGASASATAQLTGYNIKTVCRYFEKWTRQILPGRVYSVKMIVF